jgi:hypothetical protein
MWGLEAALRTSRFHVHDWLRPSRKPFYVCQVALSEPRGQKSFLTFARSLLMRATPADPPPRWSQGLQARTRRGLVAARNNEPLNLMQVWIALLAP